MDSTISRLHQKVPKTPISSYSKQSSKDIKVTLKSVKKCDILEYSRDPQGKRHDKKKK
jgi:hypothetical protein